MDKNIIKQHLSERFLSEVKEIANTPGITVTNAVTKKSGEENKAGLKAIEKDLTAYSKDVKKDKDMSKMAKNKFNYEDGELEYHNQMEIMNGQEMIEYDRPTGKNFTDRAKESLEGSSRMGNKGGKDMGNAEAMEGVSSDDFGKERLKNAEASAKKRKDQTDNILSFGDVIMELPKGSKPAKVYSAYATNESVNEKPISENISDKLRENLTNLVARIGANETAVKLVNKLSQTGMVSDFPDSMEYGSGINRVASMLEKGNFEMAIKSAKTLASKLEKQAMKDMGMFENNDNNKPQIKETMKRLKFNKNGDKPFEGVNLTQKLGHALTLIPESYKVDNKEFEMTDGSVSCKVRWEGTLNEGKAVVLLASDKTMINEDMQKMKHLMGYKSQDTLGTVKGLARLDENVAFGDIWNKTKTLLEGEDIENAKAKTGNFDEITKKAPEATKHVQGSVSKDKGTQAPAAKEGDLDDAVSHASEAKKHVEGSVSTDKGTQAPAPKTGHFDDIKKKAAEATKHVTMKESMYEGEEEETEEEEGGMVKEVSKSGNIEGTKAANGHWEDVNVPHAAEAKKHVHMGTESKAKVETEAKEEEAEDDKEVVAEGVTLNGIFFAPINENYMEEKEEMVKEEEDEEDYEDNYNKSDDEDVDTDAEPADDEITSDIPNIDDEDEEDEVKVPAAPVAKAKSGPRVMIKPATGEYFMIGVGPNPVPIPLKDKDMAKRNPAKYYEMLMDRMGDDGNLFEKEDEKKKDNSEVEEGFGDVFRSYDKIFMRDNKEMIDAVKSMPQSQEKIAKANEVIAKANEFIKAKGMEVGSATSLKNEVKRAMGYNIKNNARQS
jgi:hypothetical protein